MNPDFSGPKRGSIIDQWRALAFIGSTPSNVYRTTKNSVFCIKRMTVREEVTGHSGCVNTVHWNRVGSLLLSGSDDRKLNLYSYPSLRLIESVKSGHRANIFNAKFIPHSNDNKICSCSGDGLIHYNNLLDKRNYGKNPFKCHMGIVYDVVTHNQDPNGFISCGEDGTVRYFDLRSTSSCSCNHCYRHILMDIKQPITSCALNPLNPNEIVVGCDDSTVRAYDRRFRFTQPTKTIVQSNRPQSGSTTQVDPHTTGLIYSYRPSSSLLNETSGNRYNNRLTCVTFNWKGDEILASYCPRLLSVFSTKPKISPTVAESCTTRAALYDYSFLFPGGITPESDKPAKILTPYLSVENNEGYVTDSASQPTSDNANEAAGQTSLQDTPRSNIDTSTPRADQAVDESSFSVLILEGDEPAQERSPRSDEQGDDASRPRRYSRGSDQDNTRILANLGFRESRRRITSTENRAIEEIRTVRMSSTPPPHLTRDETEAINLAVAAYGIAPENVRWQVNSSEGENTAEINLDVRERFSPVHSGHVSSNTRSTSTARSGPLPRRSIVSSEIYSNHNQTEPTANVSDAYATNRTITAPTQLAHHAGSAPSIESHSLPATGGATQRSETDGKTSKRGKSRFSAWDYASATHSRTCVAESTARGSNDSNTNRTDIDYNPTFFNSVDSLATIHEYDRLRCYIDNLFVPSYTMNYSGHQNSRTMIKECNFYGDDYVMSGSDDGNLFIWDKWTSQLVNVLTADNNVVNCIQPHPVDPVIACSGIDSTIKIITPGRRVAITPSDINTIVSSNERENRGQNSYYFDATPTMIFHVLLALERIQRTRGEESTTTQNDQPNPDQEVDPLRTTREGFGRAARPRNRANRQARAPRAQQTGEAQLLEMDNFYMTDTYNDDDDDDNQEERDNDDNSRQYYMGSSNASTPPTSDSSEHDTDD